MALSHVPPFLLTGLALLVGSVIALPLSRFDLRQWRVPLSTLAMGVYGLFGFHFLLFVALRHAPPVQANLVNYLWPLGIVVMAPLFLPGTSLTAPHLRHGMCWPLCWALRARPWRFWAGAVAAPMRCGLGASRWCFFLWDSALKRGDARQIGVLSFLTPLLSTLTLLWVRGETPSVSVALAAVMITGAAAMATRGR